MKRALAVDQSPIGRTPRSVPATFLGVWDEIRRLYASLPESKLRGYTAQRFSFNTPSGGRCPTCQGQGAIVSEMSFLPDVVTPCEACGGSGLQAQTRCPACHGRQLEMLSESLTVTLPPGLQDGARVRLPGKGHDGPNGGDAGDVYIAVQVEPDPRYVRDGDDLHCTVEVPMVDAALGTAVGVEGILDGPIELTVPPGTQPGAVITLRGHGMPHLRSEVRGNLHAHVDVVVPAKLDHKDAELLREIKANRQRDIAAVRSAHANAHPGSNGGLFSRLRETFSGR